MRKVVLEVDSREKDPLLFPEDLIWSPEPGERVLVRVTTKVVRLPFGDYRLKSCPTGCVVERKGSMDELAQNFFQRTDRVRFHKAWGRFIHGCSHPVLYLDWPIGGCRLRYYKGNNVPADVLRRLWELVYYQNFDGASTIRTPGVIWGQRAAGVAARRRVGAELVRLMLAVEHWKKSIKHWHRT